MSAGRTYRVTRHAHVSFDELLAMETAWKQAQWLRITGFDYGEPTAMANEEPRY